MMLEFLLPHIVSLATPTAIRVPGSRSWIHSWVPKEEKISEEEPSGWMLLWAHQEILMNFEQFKTIFLFGFSGSLSRTCGANSCLDFSFISLSRCHSRASFPPSPHLVVTEVKLLWHFQSLSNWPTGGTPCDTGCSHSTVRSQTGHCPNFLMAVRITSSEKGIKITKGRNRTGSSGQGPHKQPFQKCSCFSSWEWHKGALVSYLLWTEHPHLKAILNSRN